MHAGDAPRCTDYFDKHLYLFCLMQKILLSLRQIRFLTGLFLMYLTILYVLTYEAAMYTSAVQTAEGGKGAPNFFPRSNFSTPENVKKLITFVFASPCLNNTIFLRVIIIPKK